MEVLNTVYCSGKNDKGQLGDGTNTNRSYLKQISSDSKIMNVQQIAVGASHACAVAGTMSSSPGQGTLYCWGDNQYGQLGDGTANNSNLPVAVSSGGGFTNTSVKAVIAGDNHTCAIQTVSSVDRMFCWGRNNKGQLGDGTTTNSNVPTALASPFNTAGVQNGGSYQYPVAAAGAEHTCAQSSVNTKIYCWGSNSNGQLGVGDTSDRPNPTSTGEDGASAGNTYGMFIAAGLDFTC
ncbi:MAG: hypothetical protein KGQ43_09195, partial [Acidobacteria bacterium]|nr:hypothetical protein [Acidobacteriota bacterium]